MNGSALNCTPIWADLRHSEALKNHCQPLLVSPHLYFHHLNHQCREQPKKPRGGRLERSANSLGSYCYSAHDLVELDYFFSTVRITQITLCAPTCTPTGGWAVTIPLLPRARTQRPVTCGSRRARPKSTLSPHLARARQSRAASSATELASGPPHSDQRAVDGRLG